MFLMNKAIPRSAVLCALGFAAGALSPAAPAGPADYVLPAVVEEGEREIDFKAGSEQLHGGVHQDQESVGVGLGVNSRWFTELYAAWHKEAGDARRFDAWEWENRVQLTPTGRYAADLGFVLEVERPQDRREGYELRWGPLLQADLAPQLQANLNLLVEQHVDAAVATQPSLGYQWQLKYRWKPALEYGLQGFGDFGPWNHWQAGSDQPHRLGPAVFGTLRAGGHRKLKYNAALLLGLTDGAAVNTLRAQLEYEF
jgi:hypothetical protein